LVQRGKFQTRQTRTSNAGLWMTGTRKQQALLPNVAQRASHPLLRRSRRCIHAIWFEIGCDYIVDVRRRTCVCREGRGHEIELLWPGPGGKDVNRHERLVESVWRFVLPYSFGLRCSRQPASELRIFLFLGAKSAELKRRTRTGCNSRIGPEADLRLPLPSY